MYLSEDRLSMSKAETTRTWRIDPIFGNGSFLVVLNVLAGTVALVGFIRMLGVYAAATQDFVLAESTAKPRSAPRSSGTDPLLLVAILSAAAAIELEVEVKDVRIHEIHEVSIPVSSHDWGAHGRQMIFQSHRLRS